MKHECSPENAGKMLTWIATRGGVAVWQSVNLSNPGASWSTPALQEDGTPMKKPTWQAAERPSRIITDERDISVVTRREVKRFHVGIEQRGLAFKCTYAASRRIDRAVVAAGEGASYYFDYGTQEAVITVPGETVALSDYQGDRAVAYG